MTVQAMVNVNLNPAACDPAIEPDVSQVDFSLLPGGDGINMTITSGTPDVSDPFTVDIRADTPGIDTLRATATLNDPNSTICTRDVDVLSYYAGWWQANNADVTAYGSMESIVPTGLSMIEGVDPGVATFGQAPEYLDYGDGSLSSRDWLASDALSTDVYNYSKFESMLPHDFWTSGVWNPVILDEGNLNNPAVGRNYRNYRWIQHTGPLSLTHDGDGVIDLGNNKVILFVDGDLSIDGNIVFNEGSGFFNEGSGFFMVIVSGDIEVNKYLGTNFVATSAPIAGPHLMGVYASTGAFITASQWWEDSVEDVQLLIRGSVTAGNFVLQRDMQAANDTDPVEIIDYAPGMLFMVPSTLSNVDTRWKEVAP
jgi:hypothetical protein